ncbi:MAG: ABC transporter ATP-binding protein [Pseudomonadota bacterium]|nr:ABC transporter ATP-binding protein [Pseudomonadota bacterium]
MIDFNLADKFVAANLSFNYGNTPIIKNLNITIPASKVTMIVGPNGCGKSTLLNLLANVTTPHNGMVIFEEENLAQLKPKTRAKRLAFLPQNPHSPAGITIKELVSRGRYAYQNWFQNNSEQDQLAITYALRQTDLLDIADKQLNSVSGGQRQRAWIAMVLAQSAANILMDEPTSFLDISHQLDVLALCQTLNHMHKHTIVMVLHDLNQAARFADHLIVMKAGKIVVTGSPTDVITSELLQDVFGIKAHVHFDETTQSPLIVPLHSTSKLSMELGND